MLKFILKGVMRIVSWLPMRGAHGLGYVVGFGFGHVVRHHRKEAFQGLKRSIPHLSPGGYRRIINRMYFLQGINLLELVWFFIRGLDRLADRVEIEGRDHFKAALAQGRGVIGLTGHIGNFELMPVAMTLLGIKLTIIAKKIKSQMVDEVLEEMRAVDGVTYLSTRNAYRDCLKALRRNEMVGMIIDQNMTRSEGIFVDFFGKPACTSPGLAYMAAQSKAPVLPMFIYRQPNGRHTLKILPAMEPPLDRTPESIHAATQRYTQILEAAIRETPEQWIWMHRRWKTQPAADRSVLVRNRRGSGKR